MALPSISKRAETMRRPESGFNVACRSKRWPGRKRATTGAASASRPLANSSDGGVKRLTLGVASAMPAQANKAAAIAAARLERERVQIFDVMA